jgi:quercetin dioxygenase-like cupin family protein
MVRMAISRTGLILALTLAAAPAAAQEVAHIALDAGDLQWQPAPALLPPGARVAVLEGDPAQAGPFTIRLELPAGYKVQPHTHPEIEHATILSGRAGIGLGETWDGERIRYAGPGGFFVMAPGIAHFAMIEEDSILQVHAVGPWRLDYVNPEDDPRNAPASPDAAEATTVKGSKSNTSE